MKRILLFFIGLSMILGWTSCRHDDYQAFVGTWGAERIDYYNIDYAGQPIAGSMRTYLFTPGDPVNGIDLIFRDDRSGEMRDRSRPSMWAMKLSTPSSTPAPTLLSSLNSPIPITMTTPFCI